MGTPSSPVSLNTLVELREILKTMKNDGKSWRVISKELYPHEEPDKICAILWKIDKGDYEPLDNKLRERLRLPYLREVEACPNCNKVHIERCPVVDEASLPTRGKTKVVEVCPTHGIVHCYDCETEQVKPRRNGAPARKQHYTVSLGYIPEGDRDPYRQLTPDQRRQAMDNFIKELED